MQTHECCHKTRTYGVTPTPGKCLELINADFKGPFHDRFWVLVFLDQFSKWPEVCLTKSESFESVKHQFNSFFSTWGYPRTLKSDNGPPFFSAAFKEYLEQRGIRHLPTIPETPWANEVENLMRGIRKAYDISRLKKWDYKEFIKKMIMVKRATPSPATKVSPHFAVTGRVLDPGILQGKLPFDQGQSGLSQEQQREIQKNLIESKEKTAKRHNEKRNTVHLYLEVVDTVLVRLGNKKTPERDHYLVTNVKGNEITAENMQTGKVLKRHLTRFIKIKGKTQAKQNDSNRQEEQEKEEDVMIELPVEMPPGRAPPPRDVEQNVREDRARDRRNDEAPQDQRRLIPPRDVDQNAREDRDREGRNGEDDEGQSSRTTRQKSRATGVPPPDFPNVQGSVLERSARERATATELLNQYRQDTNAALEQQRQQLLQQRNQE